MPDHHQDLACDELGGAGKAGPQLIVWYTGVFRASMPSFSHPISPLPASQPPGSLGLSTPPLGPNEKDRALEIYAYTFRYA